MEDWVFPVVCLLLGVIMLSSRQLKTEEKLRIMEDQE